MKKILLFTAIITVIISFTLYVKYSKENHVNVMHHFHDVASHMDSIKSKKVSEGFCGTYYCQSSCDEYVFYPDGKGTFSPYLCIEPSPITWTRDDYVVTATFRDGSETALIYHPSTQTINEYSPILGELTFIKTE